MKRAKLSFMLLVAGVLSLVYFVVWFTALMGVFALFGWMWATSGSGGIGAVSTGFSNAFVLVLPMLFSSFLLWRACATLEADGDRAMGWHWRFHRVVTLGGLLLFASFIVLAIVLFVIARTGPALPAPSQGTWLFVAIAVMMVVPLGTFGLSAIQLHTAVVAFISFLRSGRPAPRT